MMVADFGLEDPGKSGAPDKPTANDNLSLLAVWKPQGGVAMVPRNDAHVPPVPGIPPFLNTVRLEKVDAQQPDLYQRAVNAAEITGKAITTALSNTNDPKRGETALEILDRSNGREARLNHVYPFDNPIEPAPIPTNYEVYISTLNGFLNEHVGDNRVYLGAYQKDMAGHIEDYSQFIQIVEADADSIAALVHKNNLPGALQKYDQKVGAFERRHTSRIDDPVSIKSYDPMLVYAYESGLKYELQKRDVEVQLNQEMKAEAK